MIALAVPAAGQTPSRPPPVAKSPSAARPQPPLSETLRGQAKVDYEAGRLLFADGDYAGALIKTTAAWERAHDGRLQWNMAACQKQLRHYAEALRLVRAFMRDAAALLSEQDRREAVDVIGALQPLVTELQVDADEPGAVVLVDDVRVGTTPLPEPILLDVGRRRVRVARKDGTDYLTTVDAPGGTTVHVQATFAGSGAARPSSGADDARSDDRRRIGLVVLGVGAIGIAAGAAALLEAHSNKSNSDDLHSQGADDAGHEAYESARTWQTVSITSLTLGSAALVVGAALVLRSNKPRGESQVTLRLAPGAPDGSAGASLAGAW